MGKRPKADHKNRTKHTGRAGKRSRTSLPRPVQNAIALGKRSRGNVDSSNLYVPPEDWHEPTEGEGYQVVIQEPGRGYQHVVTEREVRQRLSELPESFIEPLEAVQFSRMTRKKQSFPCYGMQWGCAIYLYPLEESLVEHFDRPPRPAEYNETRAFGGRWVNEAGCRWKLIWTADTIRDFYLNNVLIHELGHLLDERNTSYRDRERFAEWFAIEHGLRARRKLAGATRPRRRQSR